MIRVRSTDIARVWQTIAAHPGGGIASHRQNLSKGQRSRGLVLARPVAPDRTQRLVNVATVRVTRPGGQFLLWSVER